MRTLIISDLHLGGRLRHDVLSRETALRRLLDALKDVDRLVLLGDIVELMEGRATQAMRAAEPVMRALGGRLGPRGEVLLVPGNHDAPFVRPWVRTHRDQLRVDTPIPVEVTPFVAQLAAWLKPARLEVRYPGVWLTPRVWATHGHYLDRHLMPESAYGITRGLLGSPPPRTASPAAYEQGGRPSLARASRWLPRSLAALIDELAEIVRASTMPQMRRRLLRRRNSPVNAALLGLQMRRASIPALAHVAQRLGVDADWVVFGHVHRLGPVNGDDPQQWSGADGRPAILNTGSWMYEPLLVHRARPPHPYWPGGAVLIEDGAAPRAVGLLDNLRAPDLH